MDSDEDALNDIDSGNESSGDDVDFAMEVDVRHEREKNQDIDDFPFEVLSTDNIVQHMIDCIKDVNTVLQVSMMTVYFNFRNAIHDLVLENSTYTKSRIYDMYDLSDNVTYLLFCLC